MSFDRQQTATSHTTVYAIGVIIKKNILIVLLKCLDCDIGEYKDAKPKV
jgi:hypothetical protein